MTTFEIIILIVLYLFAFGYMASTYNVYDVHHTRKNVVIILLASGTFGIILFPIILAGHIWNKLNKEE